MIGTPHTQTATKLLLLGSGELGKEVAIEANRLGIHVIACDRYANAPAMLVAQEAVVINMLDPAELEATIRKHNPKFIVPEIEAIHTDTLAKMEKEGFTVVPSAKAVQLTMNREGIRRFASDTLQLPTSKFQFAETLEEFTKSIETIGFPCVVKPIMSSSGKGQSIVGSQDDILPAWEYGQSGGRAGKGKMIIEEFISFDYEITLLTIQHKHGVTFLPPIGHKQVNGDYVESWMPQPMAEPTLKKAESIAEKITSALGGYGIFGVELFVKGEEVFFSEVSPRPHDTGLVTLISQNHSEFSLHVRALLGFALPSLVFNLPAASAALLMEGNTKAPKYDGIDEALQMPNSDVRIFGKPEIVGKRRMGVTLAQGISVEDARKKAVELRTKIRLS